MVTTIQGVRSKYHAHVPRLTQPAPLKSGGILGNPNLKSNLVLYAY